MITFRPTLLALGVTLLAWGMPARAQQFSPPAMITDGMASRPSARPVGTPAASGGYQLQPAQAYAPTVTYGAANQTAPVAMAPAYASGGYAPAPVYGPATYAPATAGMAYAPDYTQVSTGYSPYTPASPPMMAAPMPMQGQPMGAGYGMPAQIVAAPNGYPVPPPPPRVGPGGYGSPMVTTATSIRQDPPQAYASQPPAAYGYADAGPMGMMAPPSTGSVSMAPVVYAPLPQYTPGARTQTPLPASYSAMARQSVAEGDYARAQSGLEEAIKVNPFDPAALNNLAVAKAEQGQYNESVELLERATRLAPNDAEIAVNLQRMRGFLTSYAMTGTADPTPQAPTVAGSSLPPPPPPLWTRAGQMSAPMASPAPMMNMNAATIVMMPAPQPMTYTTATYGTASPQGYYTSGVCENGVHRTPQGTVEVCQTTR